MKDDTNIQSNSINYWGNYEEEKRPKVRYDPLQSFIENNKIFGFRIHLIPLRGNRPRENVIRVKKDQLNYTDKETSILMQIYLGNDFAIPIAGDDKCIGKPTDNPRKLNFENYKGICILNKYSPLSINHTEAGGISLVAFSHKYTENLDDVSPIYDILISIQTALRSLIIDKSNRKDLVVPVVFFNVGPSSGASLKQLHGQAYAVNSANGLLTYAFMKSFAQNNDCLTCRLSRENRLIDHIEQELDQTDRIIWEDQYVRLLSPYAPIRPFSLRILPKNHRNWLGESTKEEIHSISYALYLAHNLIISVSPSGWPLLTDRTIVFRQSSSIDYDYHYFVDILPCLPLGGSELIDSLSITSIDPDRLAASMKRNLDEIINFNKNFYE